MRMLNIAEKLKLPLEAVTQTFAILGIRGSGKTNSAVDLAEELLNAGQQIVVIDPTNVWWGLRSSATGKGDGYPVTLLGGERGDLPLEGGSGAIIADFIVDHGASIVLSLRHLSMSDQRRFASDFATRLYDRKGEGSSRSPLHLIIDECDEFIPQRIPPGGERMFGAFDRIVRRGRAAGLGVTLISQRAQVVNKDVLSQIETLICHRVLHKLDRKALEAWIEAHDVDGKAQEFMGSLASLGRGDAWVWSPEWLGVFARVHMRARQTYDSSSTPKAGERLVAPKRLAAVDLQQLRTSLTETIERAKADDPKELRRQIAELKTHLAKAEATKTKAQPANAEALEKRIQAATEKAEVRTKAAIAQKAKAALKAVDVLQSSVATLRTALDLLVMDASGAATALQRLSDERDKQYAEVAINMAAKSMSAAGAGTAKVPVSSESAPGLPKAERALVGVLAQFPSGRTRVQLSILSGYSAKSSSFANAISALRSKGLVAGSDPLLITKEGIDATKGIEPIPMDSTTLRRHWMSSLGKAERTMLEVLCESPKLDRAELSRKSGYSITSSSFANAISRLRSLQLISSRNDGVLELAEELR